jgi:spore coat polysaccharide biosynthesis protein SpsF
MNIVASIQARMMSTRLPGKVLRELGGKPMLLFQIERLKNCQHLNDVVVATSTNPADDDIASLCSDHGIKYYRGSEDDVLGRVSNTVKEFGVDIHVECFGDSPLVDPELIDSMIAMINTSSTHIDIVTNCHHSSFPAGMEAYIYRSQCLSQINSKVATNDPLREHCGFNLMLQRDKFTLIEVNASLEQHYPHLFLEVDELCDLEMLQNIHNYFMQMGKIDYRLDDIISAAKDRPELFEANRHVKRKWKDMRAMHHTK